jgi:hypothetical protein
VNRGGWYNFSDLCANSYEDVPDVLLPPFSEEAANLTFELWLLLHHSDGLFSGSDTVADYHLKHILSSYQRAQWALACNKQFQERKSSEDGSSSVSCALSVYPSSWGAYPPRVPGDWGY